MVIIYDDYGSQKNNGNNLGINVIYDGNYMMLRAFHVHNYGSEKWLRH